jgi:hypothetical protein
VPIIPGDVNAKRFLGEALNLQAELQATANLDVNVAIVHYVTDGFLRSAGGENIDWIGAWATFNF